MGRKMQGTIWYLSTTSTFVFATLHPKKLTKKAQTLRSGGGKSAMYMLQ